MTQEEKQLLLKDLCGRLPYGVNIRVYYEEMAGSGYFDETVWVVDNDEPFHVNDRYIENIKPYLRPMSSMTEEERTKIAVLSKFNGLTKSADFAECSSVVVDYCNSRHLDYRGLIPMGLAIEAPEGMYK